MGPDLMAEMRAQAEKFGTEIIQGHVASVDASVRPIVVHPRPVLTRTLIIATARRRGSGLLPSGVDGPRCLDLCHVRRLLLPRPGIAVVGGGDSAMEEAVFSRALRPRSPLSIAADAARVEDHAGRPGRIRDRLDARQRGGRHQGRPGEVTGMVVRHNKTGVKTEIL